MKKFIVHLMVISILYSCEKNDNPEKAPDLKQTSESTNSHLPLKVGNYWVYDGYYVTDSTEEYRRTDTIEVVSDTMLNDNEYYVLEGSYYPFDKIKYIWRDSLDYIVDHQGKIILSTSLFNEIVRVDTGHSDPEFSIWTEVQAICLDEKYTNEAGTFEVIDMRGEVFTDPENPAINKPNYIHQYFGKGVGMVFNEAKLAKTDKIYLQSRLKAYHLN